MLYAIRSTGARKIRLMPESSTRKLRDAKMDTAIYCKQFEPGEFQSLLQWLVSKRSYAGVHLQYKVRQPSRRRLSPIARSTPMRRLLGSFSRNLKSTLRSYSPFDILPLRQRRGITVLPPCRLGTRGAAASL